MKVIHISKNGTELKDISGYTVKREDAETIYALINKINEQKGE